LDAYGDLTLTFPNHKAPSLLLAVLKKPLMNQSVSLSIISSFETNGVKVIQFRVIFIYENELNFNFFLITIGFDKNSEVKLTLITITIGCMFLLDFHIFCAFTLIA
jgi:hypothetical protein